MTCVRILGALLLSAFPARGLLASDPNEQCLMCHEDQSLKDQAGRSLFVKKELVENSIHGRSGLSCVSCHADLESVKDFPHAEKLAKVNCASCHGETQKQFDSSVHADAKVGREAQAVSCVSCHGYHDVVESKAVRSKTHPLNQPETCGTCHYSRVNGKKGQGFVHDFLQSTHGIALSKTGLVNSATCATCHGSHAVKRTAEPSSPMHRRQVPNTCGQCHAGILKNYLEGVHGQDFARGIRDVPVCTDCHGEHQILSPQDKQSKVYSTQVALTCAKCHDNEELIRKYNLPEKRLRTFQGSFHGLASAYGETKVANCASCHGFHNIRRSSDPNSPINPAHLPQTCSQCHQGAGEKLSRVKIHILDPKAANYAGYMIQKAYFVLITFIIGSFVVYILADLKTRLRLRSRKV
jgi:nitrate/TMAO reductase-like tetraheme cytochrome c subunit